MKIIVVGCDKTGRSVAAGLCQENHDVVVIDNKPERLRDLAKEMDVMVLQGNGASRSVLLESGVAEADLLVALTGHDELNLLCCLMARKNGCARTICRVQSPEYGDELTDLCRELGISMIINPHMEAARLIFRSLALPPSVSSETFASGKAEIFKFRLGKDSVLKDIRVREIPARLKSNVLVCMVEREDGVYIPDGDFLLQEKDLVSVTGSQKDLASFFKIAQLKRSKVRDVMVIGGGKIAYYLASMLADSRIEMTLVEVDEAACSYFAQNQPHITVIHGNGADEKLLLDEGLMDMDAFVALTGIDEENVILALYAARKGGMKTITKINRIEFDDLIASLEVDTVVNPKQICTEQVIRYVRSQHGSLGSNVETVHELVKNRVEALEFFVERDLGFENIPLKDLAFQPDVLIALIVRNDVPIIPRGNDFLRQGDRVVMITGHKGYTSLADAMQERGRK